MKIKITARNMEDEVRIIEKVCVTDSVNRALQVYEDDLREDERLEYEIID